MPSQLGTKVEEIEKDNSHLVDRNEINQALKSEDIEALKRQGKVSAGACMHACNDVKTALLLQTWIFAHTTIHRPNQNPQPHKRTTHNAQQAGTDIVEALCSNSATFETKTEFAQDKYIKRKSKKYVVRVTLRRPTARVLCESMFEKTGGQRTWNLRADTLAAALSMANIAANGRVLVVETCQGLLAAAAVERLAGRGAVCCAAAGDKHAAAVDCVRLMNFSEAARAALHTTSLAALLAAQKRLAAGGSKGEAAAAEGAAPASTAEDDPAAAATAATEGDVAEAAEASIANGSAAAAGPAPAAGTAGGDDVDMRDSFEQMYAVANIVPAPRAVAVVAAGTLVEEPEAAPTNAPQPEEEQQQNGKQQQQQQNGGHQQQQQQQPPHRNHVATPELLEQFLQPGECRERGLWLHRRWHWALKPPGPTSMLSPTHPPTLTTASSPTPLSAQKGFTSCILAAPKLHTASLLRQVLPLLAPSASFVVFSPWQQPLAEAMSELQGSGHAVMLTLSESWMRVYQVGFAVSAHLQLRVVVLRHGRLSPPLRRRTPPD